MFFHLASIIRQTATAKLSLTFLSLFLLLFRPDIYGFFVLSCCTRRFVAIIYEFKLISYADRRQLPLKKSIITIMPIKPRNDWFKIQHGTFNYELNKCLKAEWWEDRLKTWECSKKFASKINKSPTGVNNQQGSFVFYLSNKYFKHFFLHFVRRQVEFTQCSMQASWEEKKTSESQQRLYCLFMFV